MYINKKNSVLSKYLQLHRTWPIVEGLMSSTNNLLMAKSTAFMKTLLLILFQSFIQNTTLRQRRLVNIVLNFPLYLVLLHTEKSISCVMVCFLLFCVFFGCSKAPSLCQALWVLSLSEGVCCMCDHSVVSQCVRVLVWVGVLVYACLWRAGLNVDALGSVSLQINGLARLQSRPSVRQHQVPNTAADSWWKFSSCHSSHIWSSTCVWQQTQI